MKKKYNKKKQTKKPHKKYSIIIKDNFNIDNNRVNLNKN